MLTLQVCNNDSPISVRYPNLQGDPDIGTAVEYQKALLASLDVSALDKLHFQLKKLPRRFIHESNPDDAGLDERKSDNNPGQGYHERCLMGTFYDTYGRIAANEVSRL
ncbi:hypothetical protein Tco_0808929 [Tanacetum coccineum]